MQDPGPHRAPSTSGRRTLGVRPGGRSAKVRQAILSATIDELVAHDPEAISLTRIAAAAGVARSTIVRRWPTAAALLAEAVGDLVGRAREGFSVPDLGSTEAELAYLANALATSLRDRRLEHALRAMLAIQGEAMEAARAAHTAERRRVLGEVVARAVDRGDLPPGTDPLHVGDILTAPIWMQTFMHDQPTDDHLIERVVADTLNRFAPQRATSGGRPAS